MSEQTKRYRSFISYSQKDKAYARRLHRALESYRLPRGVKAESFDAKTRKLGRFFRDDEEMGAATDLGAALQGAIADAESLIVVCSPHAARSRWVNEEIIHFKRTGRADRIFAVIVSGEPHAPAPRQDHECLPPALRFELGPDGALTDRPAEPLALDVRKEPYNRLIARLAAGLVRTPFDALWKREQRRALARSAAIVTLVGAVTLLFAATATQGLWIQPLKQRLDYSPWSRSSAELAPLGQGATFQDCRPGTQNCPVMVVVPAGTFLMGSEPDDPENPGTSSVDGRGGLAGSESPVRQVEMERFAVSRFEITFANWNACVAARGCRRIERLHLQTDQQPIEGVSADDADAYVRWLSLMTGAPYRLLTEAQWEYAARGTIRYDAPRTRFSWGDADPVCDRDAPNGAVFSGCPEPGTAPVGSFQPNRFGLYDMHGNVSEWVRGRLTLQNSDGSSETVGRLHRGGSWFDDPPSLRSAARRAPVTGDDDDFSGDTFGFRVARDLDVEAESMEMEQPAEGLGPAQADAL